IRPSIDLVFLACRVHLIETSDGLVLPFTRFHPLWGSANSALERWLDAYYEDGLHEPRGWNVGRVARLSNELLGGEDNLLSDHELSHMIVDWGQYIDHDIARTPESVSRVPFGGGSDCNDSCCYNSPCFPIQVIVSRPSILQKGSQSSGRECLQFIRSASACPAVAPSGSKTFPVRQQLNAFTSFIDASTLYGSSEGLGVELQNIGSDVGLLQSNTKYTDNGRELLPFVRNDLPSPCIQAPGTEDTFRVECFLAGDSRANEVLTLTVMHTLWLREHNRLARSLKQLNHHWSAQTCYQEARKIVGALHQVITMRDYLPKIIGPEAFEKYVGTYRSYNESINPSVSNVFTTAAFRFGHMTVSAHEYRFDEHFQDHPNFPSLPLHEAFFAPWRIIREGGVDPLLRGMLATPAMRPFPEGQMISELRMKLFGLNEVKPLDLAALNLQRGRDHGLPGYNDWREFCALRTVHTEKDLQEIISNQRRVQKLLKVYGHPGDMDVWLGGILEDPLQAGRVGPLFACLIGRQMKVLRDGDRFWWENPSVFTAGQRAEIARHSLSRIICDDSGLKHVPRDAFHLESSPQAFVPCKQVPGGTLSWASRLLH
uniref:Thyroid peroxidase n=1 Tax=Eptatretus burgeri TaxID=7764 RepID=A0A8C4QFM6_EPTBU